MRTFRKHGRPMRAALTAVTALALSGDLAAAAERLVMSYECRVTGRDLELVQSAPREYPILGPRDQQIHTACSPLDPSRCRSWRIHRFDIDCGGARVSWLDVVGAVAFQRRYPARVKGDRMVIGMGRSWGPSAREPYSGPRMRYPGAGSPYGDRYATPPAAAGRVIELPPGFAPMLGIDARFVEAPPPVAAKPVPPMDAATIAPPLPNPARKESSGERTAAASLSAATVAASESRSANTATPATTARSAVAEADRTPAAEQPATSSTSAAGDKASPGYKILNPSGEADAATGKYLRQPPSASASPAAATPPAPAPDKQTQPLADSSSADKLAMRPDAPAPAAAPTLPAPAAAAPAATATSPDSRRFTSLAGGALGAAVLAAIALVAFLASRPRAPRPVPPEARDYAAVSLGGDTGTRALVVTHPGAAREPTLPAPPTLTPPMSTGVAAADMAPAAPVGEDVLDWLPETRAEALALLGAAPDAPVEVVKRIADALRQSWHPDLAQNELDRIVREKRTKQLNVAWDLIAARSQAA